MGVKLYETVNHDLNYQLPKILKKYQRQGFSQQRMVFALYDDYGIEVTVGAVRGWLRKADLV